MQASKKDDIRGKPCRVLAGPLVTLGASLRLTLLRQIKCRNSGMGGTYPMADDCQLLIHACVGPYHLRWPDVLPVDC